MARSTDTVCIDGIYYDTKLLSEIHPGGALHVLLMNNQDATAFFVSNHRRTFPHEKYASFQIPASQVDFSLWVDKKVFTQDFSLYLKICERVKPILSESGGFSTTPYYFKVLALLVGAVGLDLYSAIVGPTLLTSLLLGLFFAWIGLNIQHDANHGAICKPYWINRVLGFSQDYIGGTSLSWDINHNTVHHLFSNDPERDHDLQVPFLRLSLKQPWHWMYEFQHVYFLVLESAFGLFHVLYNFYFVWLRGPNRSQELVRSYWTMHRIFSLLNPLRFFGMWYLQGLESTMQHYVTMYCFGGLYLAFFFLISHNFVGVVKNADASKGCFVRNQAETSCNVGDSWLAYLNGGLNFQIEHHLFPRVHHSWYASLAPHVRDECRRANVSYKHFSNIVTNGVSLVQHLHQLGHNKEMVK